MKLKYIIFLLLLYSTSINAQYPLDAKRDFHWHFGYGTFGTVFGGSQLNFNQVPVSPAYYQQEISLDYTNASIDDQNGNFLFYTNGMYVGNANHQVMPNGDTLNPGEIFNYFNGYGYRIIQGALILPVPGSAKKYYIIHEKLEWSVEYFDICPGLYYSMVDMDLNNGLGDIAQKNIQIIYDSLDQGGITATRHANGRDWWILVPEFLHNNYYILLLSPSGLSLFDTLTIGTASFKMEVGVACFSPDGTKYVRYGLATYPGYSRLEVFDFDRCSGILSNYRKLNFLDTIMIPGISVSPNSRFMYVGRQNYTLDQYDLWAPDIAASKQTVATYDGFIDPLWQLGYTTFFLHQNAPDNKIYICTGGSTRYLHIIDQPDSAGLACNVLQHVVQLNVFNGMSIPNFPNFRLGPVDGTICDSLGINVIGMEEGMKTPENGLEIWPNPATGFFNYRILNPTYRDDYSLTITNAVGETVMQQHVGKMESFGNYSVAGLPPGVYLIQLKDLRGFSSGIRKLVVGR